jgi:drug/metabolite transporter (DMT)-like permease
MFFYGFLSTLVILLLTGSNLSVDVILHGHNVLVLLIAQGVFMGAIAYLLWNWSCEKIGPAKTSIYVYGMPFVTLIVSAVVISEELTALKLVGCVITVVGVFLSQLDKGISQCKL